MFEFPIYKKVICAACEGRRTNPIRLKILEGQHRHKFIDSKLYDISVYRLHITDDAKHPILNRCECKLCRGIGKLNIVNGYIEEIPFTDYTNLANDSLML